jgi:hypothetical protein
MNENITNFFEAIERPLDASSISHPPSTLSDLWTWSLQFDVPVWLIALLALGLALSVAWHLRRSLRAGAQDIRRNHRRYTAQNLLSSLR